MMNKKEFVNYIAEKNDMTKGDAKDCLDIVVDAFTSAVLSGEGVNIVGFGKFDVVDIPERNGHNPSTGESMVIPAHKKPTFKFASNIKKEVRE